MPKTKISEYSATANSNTDVASINIDEGCAPSGINNAIRAVMGHLKDFQAGTNGDSFNGPTNGAHNGTVGATTPAAGTFTTLSATGNVTLGDAAADTVTVNGTTNFAVAPTVGGVGINGFKNRIINGAMVIDQRNAGASVTPTSDNTFMTDRWAARLTQSSKFSFQQNAGAVTPPFGYTNYLGITSLSAYSVIAADYFVVSQGIEGFNIADLGWGTANAAPITLSFWVRSSLTGTFGGALRNGAANRSYPYTYTVNAANTWEQKTLTISGDTSGTWYTNNELGLRVTFGLGVGSTFSGTAGAWTAANLLSATGTTSVVGTSGATFYITGVQLEKGSTATSFDYRPYGAELQLCQRYYYRITAPASNSIIGPAFAQSATGGRVSGNFPATMRTTPSALEQNGTAGDYVISIGADRPSTSVPAFNSLTNQYSWLITTTVSGGQTAAQAGIAYIGTSGAYLGWSAEL